MQQETLTPQIPNLNGPIVSLKKTDSDNSLNKMEIEESAQRTPPAKTKKQIFTIIRRNPTSISEQKECEKDSLSSSQLKQEAKYNRKEKSLGELSKKFLMMFGRLGESLISLDTVTVELGVERRRIYDIINILESLGVIFRRGKNNYQWKGLKVIYETLKKIQQELAANKDSKNQNAVPDDINEEESLDNAANRKEKSLGLLSTGFIKLFMKWATTISLEQAAQKLTSGNPEENNIKTKIRRLYDIANVFLALGLIKKTALESRKPAFSWVGAQGLDQFLIRLHSSSDEREIFAEKMPKKSFMKSLEKDNQKNIKAGKPLQIKSDNSAFKLPDVLATPNNTEDSKNPQAMLFDMFLEFVKQHIEGTQRKTPPQTTTDSNTATELKMLKLTKVSSSPATLMGKENMRTPFLKKSVSIIQKIDFNEISPDRIQAPTAEKGLRDVTNCHQAINSEHNAEDLEPKTRKILHRFNEDQAFRPSAFFHSLKFQKRDSSHSITL